MHISDDGVSEFQRLYRKRYGREISREQAYEQGLRLLLLLKRIYKPMTQDQFDAIQLRRAETFLEWFKKIKEDEGNSY